MRIRTSAKKTLLLGLLGLTTNLGLVLHLAGCSKKEKPEESSPTKASANQETPAASDPLMREMLSVVEACKINPEHSVISQCSDHEKRDLVRDFRRGKRDRIEALGVLTEALESKDPKLQTVAARLFEGAYRRSLGDVKPGAVDKKLAQRLLDVLPKLGKRQANQAVAAVVHAAMLAGEHEALFKTLDQLEDKNLRMTAYTHLLIHGGKPAVDKVVALSKDTDNKVVAAALQAARNWEGKDEALKAQLCQLGDDKLPSDDAIVSMRAAQIMVQCEGEHVDKLLTELEKRNKEKTVTTGLVRSLYQLCQERKGHQPGSKEQCQRTRALLEGWLQDEELNSELRAAALFELGVQFADEKSEKLCAKYENSPDLRVKTAAREAVRRIRRRMGREVVQVSGEGTTSGKRAPKRPGLAPSAQNLAPKAPAPKTTP